VDPSVRLVICFLFRIIKVGPLPWLRIFRSEFGEYFIKLSSLVYCHVAPFCIGATSRISSLLCRFILTSQSVFDDLNSCFGLFQFWVVGNDVTHAAVVMVRWVAVLWHHATCVMDLILMNCEVL